METMHFAHQGVTKFRWESRQFYTHKIYYFVAKTEDTYLKTAITHYMNIPWSGHKIYMCTHNQTTYVFRTNKCMNVVHSVSFKLGAGFGCPYCYDTTVGD